jgi:uncharacterized membrane protein
MNQNKCYITGKAYPKAALIPGAAIRSNLKELIATDYPGFGDDKYININTLQQYRKKYLQNIIDKETGMAVKVEQDMIAAITAQELMATDNSKDAPLTIGEKMADKVAEFGGSWTFIISFGTVLVVWIVLNSVFLLQKAFDPYPYILLNLVLSCIAALQAPIIMMSQNRQETKDRQRSEYDYKVNLKAELEIRMLHEKLDHLMIIQMQKIMEFQQMQMDYMEEMNDRLTEHIAEE